MLLFIIGFSFGFGSLVWVFAGESFPSHLRSVGSSVMLTSNLTANAIIAAFFLTMLHLLGGAGVFAVFGIFAVVAFAVVYRFAPETKGRQLEDIRHFWENGGRWPPESPETRCDRKVAVTLIRAGTVVIDGEVCRPGWVHTAQRRILACGAGAPPAPADVDLPNSIVVPGFVDMHVHGGGGASFTSRTDGEVERAVAFHQRHGTTTMLASLVTAAPAELLCRGRRSRAGDPKRRRGGYPPGGAVAQRGALRRA